MEKFKPLKSRVSLTLDDDVIKTIKEYADMDDRNFSQYINMVLKQHIKRKSSQNENLH